MGMFIEYFLQEDLISALSGFPNTLNIDMTIEYGFNNLVHHIINVTRSEFIFYDIN